MCQTAPVHVQVSTAWFQRRAQSLCGGILWEAKHIANTGKGLFAVSGVWPVRHVMQLGVYTACSLLKILLSFLKAVLTGLRMLV